MQRIATSTVAEDLFGAGKDGFTDGNPSTGVPATQLSAAFMNSLQEEISNVIEGASMTLSGASNTQLKEAIVAMIAASTASGYLVAAQNLGDLANLPAALTNLGFAKSMATNGWQKLPGGLIIQWGTYTISSTSQTFSYPIAFPNAALMPPIICGQSNNTYFGAQPVSNSQFTGMCYPGNATIQILALGW